MRFRFRVISLLLYLNLHNKASFNIEEVLNRITIQTWEKFEIEVPLNEEEILKSSLGKWNILHYDYFGRCYSLTLNKVGKIKIYACSQNF